LQCLIAKSNNSGSKILLYAFFVAAVGYWIFFLIIILITNFWGTLIALFVSLILGGACLSGETRHSRAGYYYSTPDPPPLIGAGVFTVCFLFLTVWLTPVSNIVPSYILFIAGGLSAIMIVLGILKEWN